MGWGDADGELAGQPFPSRASCPASPFPSLFFPLPFFFFLIIAFRLSFHPAFLFYRNFSPFYSPHTLFPPFHLYTFLFLPISSFCIKLLILAFSAYFRLAPLFSSYFSLPSSLPLLFPFLLCFPYLSFLPILSHFSYLPPYFPPSFFIFFFSFLLLSLYFIAFTTFLHRATFASCLAVPFSSFSLLFSILLHSLLLYPHVHLLILPFIFFSSLISFHSLFSCSCFLRTHAPCFAYSSLLFPPILCDFLAFPYVLPTLTRNFPSFFFFGGGVTCFPNTFFVIPTPASRLTFSVFCLFHYLFYITLYLILFTFNLILPLDFPHLCCSYLLFTTLLAFSPRPPLTSIPLFFHMFFTSLLLLPFIFCLFVFSPILPTASVITFSFLFFYSFSFFLLSFLHPHS